MSHTILQLTDNNALFIVGLKMYLTNLTNEEVTLVPSQIIPGQRGKAHLKMNLVKADHL